MLCAQCYTESRNDIMLNLVRILSGPLRIVLRAQYCTHKWIIILWNIIRIVSGPLRVIFCAQCYEPLLILCRMLHAQMDLVSWVHSFCCLGFCVSFCAQCHANTSIKLHMLSHTVIPISGHGVPVAVSFLGLCSKLMLWVFRLLVNFSQVRVQIWNQMVSLGHLVSWTVFPNLGVRRFQLAIWSPSRCVLI